MLFLENRQNPKLGQKQEINGITGFEGIGKWEK